MSVANNENLAEYVTQYEKLSTTLPGTELAWLKTARSDALARFKDSGFPSPRQEEWKYTNVTPIERKLFKPVAQPASIAQEALSHWLMNEAWLLVLVDGHYMAELSDLPESSDSIQVLPLSEALKHNSAKVEEFLTTSRPVEAHGFLDFNLAGFTDGLYLRIAKNAQLDKPVQVLNYSSTAEGLANTRHLLVLEENSSATVVETFAGQADMAYLTASVTEVNLASSARLKLTRLQAESERAYHFSGTYITEAANAVLEHDNFTFGGLLSRHETHTHLGKAAECSLNGLFLGCKRQHVDNHTRIHHAEPHSISRQLYKGILDQGARGVFQGRVLVDKDAQQIASEMNNRNLLLSEQAEVDTKPQLEIHADDVKCSHGVTVGQLSDESIFYLQSRGVDREDARTMLTFAFANEMVEHITDSALHDIVQAALLNSFTQSGIRKEWL